MERFVFSMWLTLHFRIIQISEEFEENDEKIASFLSTWKQWVAYLDGGDEIAAQRSSNAAEALMRILGYCKKGGLPVGIMENNTHTMIGIIPGFFRGMSQGAEALMFSLLTPEWEEQRRLCVKLAAAAPVAVAEEIKKWEVEEPVFSPVHIILPNSQLQDRTHRGRFGGDMLGDVCRIEEGRMLTSESLE